LENGIVNLCNRLSPERFAPSVCVFQAGGALERRLNGETVKLVTAKAFLGNDPTLPFRLAWHLRRMKVDILHTHSWGTLVEGILAAKMARIPSIIHGEHGVMEERRRNIAVQRWLWPKAQQVTAVASSLADRMAELMDYPRDRIQVIPNGVDTEKFQARSERKSEFRREFSLPEGRFLLGMVARLEKVKNHHGAIRGLSILKSRGIEVDLALAGSGSLRDELEKTACESGVRDRMHFLGDVARVDRFLNAIDVFVLNSHSEGMSNTLLEAMSSGLPVVATRVGSNPQLVESERFGMLIPADDDEALASAVERLHGDTTLRNALGANARRRIELRFSIDRMVRDYEELYLSVASKTTKERTK
jgi:sugar transferase (PEP-CTERM/EpsH1 system associated)